MSDVPRLERALILHDVMHGFTTRSGGVSTGARGSLHLALREGDRVADVRENWSRVGRACGFALADLVLLDQVHGAAVLEATNGTGPLDTLGAADGVVTQKPGLVLAIRTADCVPVLLAAPGGVGAAHAGWRGVEAGVVAETVGALCALVGCEPGAVRAAVGPCASVDAYETGPEVVDALVARGLPRERVSRMGARGREHTDLRSAVQLQLEGLGVGRVEQVGGCTITDARYFSHRRDGAQTGRQASLIRWAP